MAYSTIHMLPERAADWRAAMQASVLANVNRTSESEPVELEEFLPRMIDETPDSDEAVAARSLELLARFEAMAQATARNEASR